MGLQEILQKIENTRKAVGKSVDDLQNKIGFHSAKGFIEVACAVTPDYYTLQLAKIVTMSPNGNAAKHLDYYLAGTGLNLYVNLEKVLKDDIGVKSKVQQEIKDGLKLGKDKGSVAIPQKVYRNHDWQYAIGSMNVNWHTIGQGKVRLFFENQYRWHPSERRVSQCVHQAAVNLQKKISARDYLMYGETVIYIREL